MKAIQTEYKGYKFRSRLEARWAVFFDSLGVDWEYEPEGFQLQNGLYYLPDFKVKCYGKRGDFDSKPFDLYIEVKGEITKQDAEKIKNFEEPILVLGSIPNDYDEAMNDIAYDDYFGVNFYNYIFIDDDYFGAFPTAHEDGKLYLLGSDSNYVDTVGAIRANKALFVAKQARFEHGEQP